MTFNTYQFPSTIVLVLTYFLCAELCENVLGNSIEVRTQNKRSIKNERYSLNTSTPGRKLSIENTTSSKNYQYRDVLTHILLHRVQQNYEEPKHLSHLPKFWSVVHKINDTTTKRTIYNGVVTNEVNDNQIMTAKEHSQHKSKKKRDVVDGSVPFNLCKASEHSSDVFSSMLSLNLIDPNDTGILSFSKSYILHRVLYNNIFLGKIYHDHFYFLL